MSNEKIKNTRNSQETKNKIKVVALKITRVSIRVGVVATLVSAALVLPDKMSKTSPEETPPSRYTPMYVR